METLIPERLSVLGHPQRLAILRLLMRRYPDRVPAGDIARALDIKASTLSSYLSNLMQVGLVTQERSGTSLLYAPDMGTVGGTFGYLFNDCCRGRPDLCPPLNPPPEHRSRSDDHRPLSRALHLHRQFRPLDLRRVDPAGPRRRPVRGAFRRHKAALRAEPLRRGGAQGQGPRHLGARAKNVAEFQVPRRAGVRLRLHGLQPRRERGMPAWPGQPVSGHWGMPDPVQAEGTDAERALAFHQAYGALHNRIQAFVALPFEALDRMSLQKAVDDIGRIAAVGRVPA
jgi:DNA-binding transcriptional ArsR family regulator